MADHQGRAARAQLLTALVPLTIGAALTFAVPVAAHADGGRGGSVGDCAGRVGFVCLSVHDRTTTKPSGGKPRPKGKSGTKPVEVCVVERLQPQPPASDPVWDGHSPKDGAIYLRMCNWQAVGSAAAGATSAPPQIFWAAAPPAVTVDPLQLAHEAVDKMKLTGPDIASPRADGVYAVGVPMWLWADRGPTTYGPNTASATAGGVTVTATATVSKIVWAMGDGSSVTCSSAGTPYKPSLGKRQSPDCGHVYRKSSRNKKDNAYRVAATSTWSVDWQVTGAGGESGQFTETRASQLDVVIGQVKVLN
ncbi:ATP/GTP-binding protein (plasmid) [Streptomyces sp. NBC_01369]